VTYTETFRFDVPASTVYDALLDEKTLTGWLAENVQVEPRKGGAYRFFGRDVIWCNTEAETEGEILELDRPRSLVVSWRWKGHDTRVAFSVEEVEAAEAGVEHGDGEGARRGGPKCRLTVEHRFETFDPGPQGPGPDMAGCHWRIAVGNLTSLFARGCASLRPDYTAPAHDGERRVELEIDIDAPPERVFRALLDPDQVRVWMQTDAPEIDPDASRYSFGWRRGDEGVEVGPVRLLELVPNRLLVHDWQWLDEPRGRVRWELSPIASGTRLRLLHTASADLTHALGWSDALIRIRRLVEGLGADPAA